MLNDLYAKIASMLKNVATLRNKLVEQQRSLSRLSSQKNELEAEMIERSGTDRDHERWVSWSTPRYQGMMTQMHYLEVGINRLVEDIDHRERTITNLRDKSVRLEAEILPEVDKTIKATLAKAFGPKIKHGKKRRNVAKGERAKSAKQPKPAKKQKGAKAQQKGHGHQRAA